MISCEGAFAGVTMQVAILACSNEVLVKQPTLGSIGTRFNGQGRRKHYQPCQKSITITY
jgi:hypothetical protein